MQVTVTVSDAIVREAGVRGLPVIDFVESLIDKGMSAAQGARCWTVPWSGFARYARLLWGAGIKDGHIHVLTPWTPVAG